MTINLAQWRRDAARRRTRAMHRARQLKVQLEAAGGVDISLLTSRLRRAVAAARTAHREWRLLSRSLRQERELKKVRQRETGFNPRECESPPEHFQRRRAWASLQWRAAQ